MGERGILHRAEFPEEPEFGVRQFLPAKSYQLDRGTLEAHLRKLVRPGGADAAEGQRVIDICLAEPGQQHAVRYRERRRDQDAPQTLGHRDAGSWTRPVAGGSCSASSA